MSCISAHFVTSRTVCKWSSLAAKRTKVTANNANQFVLIISYSHSIITVWCWMYLARVKRFGNIFRCAQRRLLTGLSYRFQNWNALWYGFSTKWSEIDKLFTLAYQLLQKFNQNSPVLLAYTLCFYIMGGHPMITRLTNIWTPSISACWMNECDIAIRSL